MSKDYKILLLLKSFLFFVYLSHRVHSYCNVSSNDVLLTGLTSNSSNLSLGKRYPAIKCQALRLQFRCFIIIAEEDGSANVVQSGDVLFAKESVSWLHCLCQNRTLKYDYCSATWQVQVGSSARIASFRQSGQFEVSCSTHYKKEKNVTLILDGSVLTTWTSYTNQKFSFDMRLGLGMNGTGENLNGRNITCQMENAWGREEKSFHLDIKYDPKPTHIAVNKHFGTVLFVDLHTNVTCTCEIGNPKPKRIAFIAADDRKFRIVGNRLIPKMGGNYSVTCRVELENGFFVDKQIQLSVAFKDAVYENPSAIMAASSIGSVIFIICIIMLIFCFYKNHRKLNDKGKKLSNTSDFNKQELEYHVKLPTMQFENNVQSTSISHSSSRGKFHQVIETKDLEKELFVRNRSNSV